MDFKSATLKQLSSLYSTGQRQLPVRLRRGPLFRRHLPQGVRRLGGQQVRVLRPDRRRRPLPGRQLHRRRERVSGGHPDQRTGHRASRPGIDHHQQGRIPRCPYFCGGQDCPCTCDWGKDCS